MRFLFLFEWWLMERVAEILINLTTRKIKEFYSYLVPEKYDYLTPGWRVIVPFGNRSVEGFIIRVTDQAASRDFKKIIDALDAGPWFDANMLNTAKWLSQYYLCPLADAMRLFIPGKAGLKTLPGYRVAGNPAAYNGPEFSAADSLPRQVYMYIQQKGLVSENQLKKQFPGSLPAGLRFLRAHKLVVKQSLIQKAGRPQTEKILTLKISPAAAAAFAAGLKSKPAQRGLLQLLVAEGGLNRQKLKDLKVTPATAKKLLATGIIKVVEKPLWRDSYKDVGGSAPKVVLNKSQQAAVQAIKEAITTARFESFLLYGVTGSGKTQVYIETVATVRQQGRGAIVLVPEIALTGQIVTRFKARFGDDVVVIHSKLTINERYDAWERIRSRQAGIVIGARSAVFAPLPAIGIIVMDEEHEFTYKQEESPRYHTREVAERRARLAGGVVVYGSATPAVETYYDALRGRNRLLVMPERVDSAVLPAIKVADMRTELKKGRRTVISALLHRILAETFAAGEQAIILLNRRGYATFILCRECGFVLRCNHCSVSLVYHADDNSVRCHYCQRRQPVPDVCPACGSRYIRFFGTGTQKLEEELKKLFPGLRIARMDQDTTTGKNSPDRLLTAFAAGKADLLLGTQMVAKGHDIKNVTAVGVVSADTTLNFPDFRAAERTFALLTQAAGRAGRGEKRGRVVIQTYNPENYAVKAAILQDYDLFYREEIKFRRELGYPPFCQLIKIVIESPNEEKARRDAGIYGTKLKRALAAGPDVQIMGPFSAPVARINDVYRLNIIIKAPDLTRIKKIIYALGNYVGNSKVIFDVDPVSAW